MKKVILIGGGTFSSVVIDAILDNDAYSQFIIEGIIDDARISGGNIEYPYLGKIEDIPKFVSEDVFFVISIGNPSTRKVIAEKYPELNYLTVIDKTANISDSAKIGKGNIILKSVIVNAFVQTEAFAIINAGAIVDHHCLIEKYSHIGQGAVLWNSAHIQEASHIFPLTVIKGK